MPTSAMGDDAGFGWPQPETSANTARWSGSEVVQPALLHSALPHDGDWTSIMHEKGIRRGAKPTVLAEGVTSLLV